MRGHGIWSKSNCLIMLMIQLTLPPNPPWNGSNNLKHRGLVSLICSNGLTVMTFGHFHHRNNLQLCLNQNTPVFIKHKHTHILFFYFFQTKGWPFCLVLGVSQIHNNHWKGVSLSDWVTKVIYIRMIWLDIQIAITTTRFSCPCWRRCFSMCGGWIFKYTQCHRPFGIL